MSKSELILDVKSAVGDFRKYDEVTQQRFKATLLTEGGVLKRYQREYLRHQVEDWTNGIGSTFAVGKVKNFSIEVGPGGKVAYAWFLEAGATAKQQALGNFFAGYFYVRDTLEGVERSLIKSLKKDIENYNA